MRIVNLFSFFRNFYEFFFSYPAPSNLTYFWNFGVYSLVCLGIQILTGIFLAMHYCSDYMLAFVSIEHIMRDVQYGWLLRYIHANGASMFFIVVYIHIFRGLYYSSYLYPRHFLWISGVVILLIMIITAFLGYVLPWGQMSFWAATVITNLVSAVPKVGKYIVIWLWGGYAVDNATLNRFFSLHYLLPFLILGLVFIHLIILHTYGSNNPLGIEFKYIDHVTMYPYYIYKDLFGLIIFIGFFSLFLFFMPNILGHTDNYILANPMVTPTHIVPEWYFLPFYAILRSIPDKLLGVIFMLFSLILLGFLPIINNSEIKSLNFRPLSRFSFWFIVIICFLLGWIGSKPADYPYVQIGQFVTFLYFFFFLFYMPIIIRIEYFFWVNSFYLKFFF
jgi:ubiquinol-cytochrome c reductase cytochrome b subunit